MTEKEQLEERIRKAREQRAELDRQREERAELEQLRRQAEREENALRDTPAITAAEDEHGADRIAVLETDRGSIVVKRPSPLHHQGFANKQNKITTNDLLAYVKPCVVYPDPKTLEAWFAELPGQLIPLSELVLELAKGRAAEVAKK